MKLTWHTIVLTLVCGFACHCVLADDAAQKQKKTVRKSVKLPGLVIDIERCCVDLEAIVCLDNGLLELVACTQGSKEHESIVAVSARAMHIHTALLLLGADDGHPAIRKQVGGREKQWVSIPPQGDVVEVFLVTTTRGGKSVERPVSDFIIRSSQRVDEVDGAVITAPEQNRKPGDVKNERFSHTFVFAGSHLRDNGSGPRQYLADLSGNVISIATFGDELLCLPFRETQQDNALMWRVKPESLPKVGTKMTLRLRPRLKKTERGDAGTTSADSYSDYAEERTKTSGTNQ